MGLFMSASDDSDLDSMSGEESVPGDSDSSMPLGDSQEENGNELPDSTDSEENELGSWEALIETGTLLGHAALAVQDHEAGEATVDCRPNQPCLASTLVTTPDRGMAVSLSIIPVLVILVNAEIR